MVCLETFRAVPSRDLLVGKCLALLLWCKPLVIFMLVYPCDAKWEECYSE